jgi:hypothetical protein
MSNYADFLKSEIRSQCGIDVVFAIEKKCIGSNIITGNPSIETKQRHIACEIELETAGAMFKGKVPTILIIEGRPENTPDSIICHELWHLLLSIQSGIYASGYASPLFDSMISRIPSEHKLMDVFNHANTILHHSYIFDKMLSAGYSLRDSFCQFLENNEFYRDYETLTKDFHAAIDTWHLLDAQNDNSFDSGSLLNIIERNCNDPYHLGIRLYEIAKEFISPADEPEVFKRILSELFEYNDQIGFVKGDKDGIYNLGIYH